MAAFCRQLDWAAWPISALLSPPKKPPPGMRGPAPSSRAPSCTSTPDCNVPRQARTLPQDSSYGQRLSTASLFPAARKREHEKHEKHEKHCGMTAMSAKGTLTRSTRRTRSNGGNGGNGSSGSNWALDYWAIGTIRPIRPIGHRH